MKVVFKFTAMIVCLCKGISDKHVRESIARGNSSVAEVAEDCGAGTGCGTCHDMLQMMVDDCGHSSAIDLARAAARVAAKPTCADCPRRSQTVAAITSPSLQKLGEAA